MYNFNVLLKNSKIIIKILIISSNKNLNIKKTLYIANNIK